MRKSTEILKCTLRNKVLTPSYFLEEKKITITAEDSVRLVNNENNTATCHLCGLLVNVYQQLRKNG